MLMPAAVLIVIVLGAIAVDLSVVQLADRELTAAAAGAANDAVTYGLDEELLRRDGIYRLDPARVDEAVRRSLLAGDVGDEVTTLDITQPDAESVTVTVSMPVDRVFAKGIPGAAPSTTVTARATATVERR
jgi:hypothetical protein